MAEINEHVGAVWRLLLDGWDQTLVSAGRSRETRTAYRKAGVAFVNWLAELPAPPAGWAPPRSPADRRAARRAQAEAGAEAMPLYRPAEAAEITQDHIERFLIGFATERTARCPNGRSQSTVNQVFRSLQQWMVWLIDEEEIDTSPMERMDPPAIGERAAALLEIDQLNALVAVCKGKDFRSRRDEALIRVFADTGGRRAEVAGIHVEHIDLGRQRFLVTGKGDKQRHVHFGGNTARALNRYMRIRAHHRHQALPDLWLAERGGPMTTSGIYQVVRRRGQEAGVTVHPHLFRHMLADAWLDAGGGEQTLADHMGWTSTAMIKRYGAAGRGRRAANEHERLGLGNRI